MEHLTVRRVREDIYVAAFVMARDAVNAGQLAERVGFDLTADLRGIRFGGYRVWRNDVPDGPQVGGER